MVLDDPAGEWYLSAGWSTNLAEAKRPSIVDEDGIRQAIEKGGDVSSMVHMLIACLDPPHRLLLHCEQGAGGL